MKIGIAGDITKDTYLKLNNDEAHLMCKINSSNCEICFSYAEKLPVEDVIQAIGGNAANVAIAFNKLGLNSILLTQVGADLDSKYLLAELKRLGVDIDGVTIAKNEKANNSTIINYQGERTVLSFHQKREYKLKSSTQAEFIYLTSMGEGWQKVYEQFLTHKLIYQPGTLQIKQGSKASRKILAKTNILILNKNEAQLFLNTESQNERTLLHKLLDTGVQEAVITDGKHGSYATDGVNFWQCGIWQQASRVETTGAGDSFSATYTSMRLQNHSIEDSLVSASLNSGSVIQQVGAHDGLLSAHQLEALKKRIKIKTQNI